MAELETRDELAAALEQERLALAALLPRFDEGSWSTATRADGWSAHDVAAHLADSTYGLALLVLGEIAPSLELNEGGWLKADDYNAERRAKNTALPRAKVEARLMSSFAHAQRAIAAGADLGGPGPYGPVHTRGRWLYRIVEHLHEHRTELEQMLEA
jgi:hypothetical protein